MIRLIKKEITRIVLYILSILVCVLNTIQKKNGLDFVLVSLIIGGFFLILFIQIFKKLIIEVLKQFGKNYNKITIDNVTFIIISIYIVFGIIEYVFNIILNYAYLITLALCVSDSIRILSMKIYRYMEKTA